MRLTRLDSTDKPGDTGESNTQPGVGGGAGPEGTKAEAEAADGQPLDGDIDEKAGPPSIDDHTSTNKRDEHAIAVLADKVATERTVERVRTSNGFGSMKVYVEL